jgi:hypothetical protein
MLRKRRQVRRTISDREFMNLLQRFRIPLAELVFQSQRPQSRGPDRASKGGA